MAYLGENIKKLGFGLMRLPKKDGAIDIKQVAVMVDNFIAAGFTYFDTAWAYPGSEEAIRKALIERYPRERFQLADKNAAWINCKTREDAIAQFDVSLERTGAGYFDFYLLHNLGAGRTKVFEDFNMWRFIREKQSEGKIKHIGFSFHGTPEELDVILNEHPETEFVQLQINYADWDNPAVRSRECYETALKHEKPVIIMEPVKGGMLAFPPQPVIDVLKSADPNASAASWALRFAANLPNIITVLSGMSNIEQLKDNIASMEGFTHLTDDQALTVKKAREALAEIPLIPCTVCNYCAKVCPENIGISGTFSAMNHFTLYNNMEAAKNQEGFHVGMHGKRSAKDCIKCGKCEKVCPQGIAIRKELERTAKTFL